MTRPFRLIALLLVVLATAAVAGCEDKSRPRTFAETEGPYLNLDGLSYQIQMSRILQPSSPEDSAYLKGLAEGVDIDPKTQTWFGVWLRVENATDETLRPADSFRITDTLENEFFPMVLDPSANSFVYQPSDMPPGSLLPVLDSPAAEGPIQEGALILFRVSLSSLFNRPLEFHIEHTGAGTPGRIALDV